jgi:hypothetical protein
MAQVRPASTGVVVVSMSWPYRHRPASRRSVSRAPRPAGLTSGWPAALRPVPRPVGRHRDLEAVLAGVARARDEAVGTRQREVAAGHEGQLFHAGFRRASAVHRLRALQRQQARSGRAPPGSGGRCGCRWRDVGVLAAGVDDHEQVVRGVRATIRSSSMPPWLVGEQRVALLAHGQVDTSTGTRVSSARRRRHPPGAPGPCATRRTARPGGTVWCSAIMPVGYCTGMA